MACSRDAMAAFNLIIEHGLLGVMQIRLGGLLVLTTAHGGIVTTIAS